jgi:hypothetical protein
MVWVHLAREALHAEWPTFEAIRAFSVFQLRPRLETSIVKKDLGKICQIFGEQKDLAVLTRSYQDVVYTASKKRTLSYEMMVEVNLSKLAGLCHIGIFKC